MGEVHLDSIFFLISNMYMKTIVYFQMDQNEKRMFVINDIVIDEFESLKDNIFL